MTLTKPITIAVAGNPNSGKTTLFNTLTGSSQKVGNYPGVTVEKKEGYRKVGDLTLHFVDLPGTYSLTTFSQDEVVARDFILEQNPDLILDVIDSTNLERNLYLALQLIEIGKPLVIALNMQDIARQRGIVINAELLSERLGVPVVETIGQKKVSAVKLEKVLTQVVKGELNAKPKPIPYDDAIEPGIAELTSILHRDTQLNMNGLSRWVAMKLLEKDQKAQILISRAGSEKDAIQETVKRLCNQVENEQDEDMASLIAEGRYACASDLVRHTMRRESEHVTLTDRVDWLACHRIFGPVLVCLVVFATFSLTFQLSDGWAYVPWPGEWQTPCGVLGWFFDEFLTGIFVNLSDGPLKSLILDGAIAGVGGVLGFVPIIFFMFFLLAIIEDSGYIARISFILDRALRTFGLQGKSIMAMIVSGGIAGGCAVPGVMSTRTLGDPKDRITTMMVAPLMNCGAKVPVFAMLIAAFFAAHKGLMMMLLVILAWGVALSAAFVLRKTVARGPESPFVMELPPYHLPTFTSVFRSACQRSWSYMRKAFTIILAVSVVMWAMMYFPRNDASAFEGETEAATSAMVAETPSANLDLISDENLEDTLAFAALFSEARESEDSLNTLREQDPHRYASLSMAPASFTDSLTAYADQIAEIENNAAGAQLRQSVAGRIGLILEPLTKFAGFDWRDNIALTGGFAAKEIIVSTMGTAYSMGAVEPVEDVDENLAGNPLSRQLARDPGWNPLRAFALVVFVMFYAPCLVTTAVIWKESGHWKWAGFATAYSTIMAFTLAALVFQIGSLLGLGV